MQGDNIRSVGKTSSLVEIKREEECSSVYTKYQIISYLHYSNPRFEKELLCELFSLFQPKDF